MEDEADPPHDPDEQRLSAEQPVADGEGRRGEGPGECVPVEVQPPVSGCRGDPRLIARRLGKTKRKVRRSKRSLAYRPRSCVAAEAAEPLCKHARQVRA